MPFTRDRGQQFLANMLQRGQSAQRLRHHDRYRGRQAISAFTTHVTFVRCLSLYALADPQLQELVAK